MTDITRACTPTQSKSGAIPVLLRLLLTKEPGIRQCAGYLLNQFVQVILVCGDAIVHDNAAVYGDNVVYGDVIV